MLRRQALRAIVSRTTLVPTRASSVLVRSPSVTKALETKDASFVSPSYPQSVRGLSSNSACEKPVSVKKPIAPLQPRSQSYNTLEDRDIAFFKSVLGEENVLRDSNDIEVRQAL